MEKAVPWSIWHGDRILAEHDFAGDANAFRRCTDRLAGFMSDLSIPTDQTFHVHRFAKALAGGEWLPCGSIVVGRTGGNDKRLNMKHEMCTVVHERHGQCWNGRGTGCECGASGCATAAFPCLGDIEAVGSMSMSAAGASD